MALDDMANFAETATQVVEANGNGATTVAVEEIATRVATQAAQVAAQQVIDSAQPKSRKGTVTRVSVPPSQLAKFFPSTGEKLVIRLRRVGDMPNNRMYVGSFNASDIQGYLNIEEFLKALVVPSWGPGDYTVALAAPNGVETRVETFPMHPPTNQNNNGGSGLFGALKDLPWGISSQQQGVDLSQLNPVSPSLTPNPMDNRLDRLERLLDRQSQGPDPRDVLIKKLVDRLDDMDRNKNQPVAQPVQQPLDIASVVSQIAAVMRPATPPPDNSLEKLLLLVDRMVPKEQPKQTDPWDMITKLATVKRELFGDMAEQQKELNKKLDAYINQPAPDPLEEVERVQRMWTMMKQMVNSEGDSYGSFIGQIFKGLPGILDKAKGVVEAQAKTEVAKADQVRQVAQIKQAQAAKQVTQPELHPTQIEYPEGFGEYLIKLQNANGAKENIEATLRAFEFLGKHEGWNKFYNVTYNLAKSGDKKAIKYLERLLQHMEVRQEIDVDKRTSIVDAFNNYWEQIISVAFNDVDRSVSNNNNNDPTTESLKAQ